MKLDIKDRLVLSYQLKILERLYPEEREHYANHRKAIEDGYELHYKSITQHLSDGLTTDECNFVLDVLDMYRAFNVSFKHLENPTNLTEDLIKFPGFDGNHETDFMVYTEYLIEDLKRFDKIRESTNGYYNSHTRMIPKYKVMLIKWREIYKPPYTKLSEEQILEIINIHGY